MLREVPEEEEEDEEETEDEVDEVELEVEIEVEEVDRGEFRNFSPLDDSMVVTD